MVRLTALLMLLLITQPLVASEASEIFEQTRTQIFQILVIDVESDAKSAIGSGFLVGDQGDMATNFHVISEAVHEPEQYRVEYLDAEGESGLLEIAAFDVIHDLALLRPSKEGSSSADYPAGLAFAETEVVKGETIYSLGNPFDLGQTIVPGTYNGLLENSFYQKLLFSGSLNPGMSGGPSLNESGAVIGVNVASSGNQISFLVPVKYLIALLKRHAGEFPLATDKYTQELARQLYEDQNFKYSLLLNLDWQSQKLGEVRVGAELSDYFKCWGDTENEDDVLYEVTQSSCSSQDNIFISSRFHTGAIDYEYAWAHSNKLNDMQFQWMLSQIYSRIYTRNAAAEEDVTNYQCKNRFVTREVEATGIWRSVFCVRQYKRFPQLFDVLYLGNLIDRPRRGLSSHFALSGVSMKNALAFAEKFMQLQSWDS